MNYWTPSHLNLLPGQDHVAPPHPLIFPGFPFMKTRVLRGRVDIYGVLALVWIWDRLRVQTWIGQCGSSPRPCACSFLLGWGRGQGFPDCPGWVVGEVAAVGDWRHKEVLCLGRTGEHRRAAAVRAHQHQEHRKRQGEGETSKNKNS